MPIYFSDEERKLIAKYIKTPRPTHYSATAQDDVQISEDMEKFIILTPPEGRNDIVAWIQDSNKKTKDKEDRETLLSEALDSELADAKAQIKEADSALENYDKFLSKYFTNIFPDTNGVGPDGAQLKTKRDRFGDVAEVGQALSDVSTSVDEFLIIRDRAKHLEVVTTVLQTVLSKGRLTQAEKNQISGWATPFTAYTNGKT
jgi:hypothetical protein